MVKATDVVCKYNEGEFAVKHKKDGFKAGFRLRKSAFYVILNSSVRI